MVSYTYNITNSTPGLHYILPSFTTFVVGSKLDAVSEITTIKVLKGRGREKEESRLVIRVNQAAASDPSRHRAPYGQGTAPQIDILYPSICRLYSDILNLI